MCLAQEPHAMTPVKLEPAAPRPRVKHSSTEPLRSHIEIVTTILKTANSHSLNTERSGSVVECLTRDRRAAGSSLTGVTALWIFEQDTFILA